MINQAADSLAGGLLLGSVWLLLRTAANRSRGAVTAVASLTLAAGLYAWWIAVRIDLANTFFRSWIEERVGDSPFWTVVAIAGLFVANSYALALCIDVAEKLLSGRSLAIADLVRLMNAAAVIVLAVSLLLPMGIFVHNCAIAIAFLLGDWTSQKPWLSRHAALAFVTGFLVLIGSYLHASLGPLPAVAFNTPFLGLGFYVNGVALLLLTLGLQFAPRGWRALHVRLPAAHRLASSLGSTAFFAARPTKHISRKLPIDLWHFEAGTTYLNHGSFGAVPLLVRDYQRQLQERCTNQPMKFLAREFQELWLRERAELAARVGAAESCLTFCDNATVAMNEIAHGFPLRSGDEVLINDHEYGAVKRIWSRACSKTDANLVEVQLPIQNHSQTEIADSILSACNDRTRLVIASHITSPTAIRLPIEVLCQRLRERNIPTCIDGPHAVLQEKLALERLGCDFYTASCHKWLCAPIGSGFLYAAPQWHATIEASRLSWGRLPPITLEHWSDEYVWTGTKDNSAFLTVNRAFQFFDEFDNTRLDERNHELARYARAELCRIPGTEPVTPDSRAWFGWMVGVWLPPEESGSHQNLQARLADKYQIEIPVVRFHDRFLIRVSCHLYNCTDDIDYLCRCLRQELRKVN